MIKKAKKKNTADVLKPENTGEVEGARPNTKVRGECSIANIDRVGGYVNHSGNERMNRSLEKKCGSVVEGTWKRFAIQKHKNGDGILRNWLATSKTRGGGVCGTYCDVNTKLGNDTGDTK